MRQELRDVEEIHVCAVLPASIDTPNFQHAGNYTGRAVSSADSLDRYLDRVAPYDEIYIVPPSHGVVSVGLAPIERWRSILRQVRRHGDFLGVNEAAYPRDFVTSVN